MENLERFRYITVDIGALRYYCVMCILWDIEDFLISVRNSLNELKWVRELR